ncbi:MAG: serine/threonine protein kinase, partial [Planctomycetota bacterium]|nr:serine/threonine protein kinase [Planctomycetota bacterium]
PGRRQGPDAAIRRRLKVPEDQATFVVGAWTVEQYLADGAQGVVYRVTRPGDPRPFALKVLKQHEPKPEVRQRFVREAQTMAKLTHPGIVHVHDAGVASGLLWFVMDFLPGPTLKGVLEEQERLPIAEGLRVMQRLCEAVAYAHGHGVLHRDLKPDNVIMAQGRDPVLTDFGLAKDTQSSMNLTAEGQRIGTPLYMAPELLLDAEVATPQSEVYALAAMLYQVLTGKVPFYAKSVIDLAELIEKGKFTPLREACPDAPKALEKLCARALHKDPGKRPQTVEELRAELAGMG